MLSLLFSAPATASAATPAATPVATPAAARTTQIELTPMGAAWRSTLVPGWGQRYKGETAKGWVMTGVFGGLIGASGVAIAEMQSADRAYRHLDDAAPAASFDSAYRRDTDATLVAEVVGGLTAGFWAYSIGDSFFTGVDKLRIRDARIHDVFPSTAKFWQSNSFASITVENRSAEPLTNIKVTLLAPEVMTLAS